MEVAAVAASTFGLHSRILSPSLSARIGNRNRTLNAPLRTNFASPFAANDSKFAGVTLCFEPLHPASLARSKPRRIVVTNVFPYKSEDDKELPPPDLASYLLAQRIVYLAMPLVFVVVEIIVSQFLYLQATSGRTPIYMYINSFGSIKGNQQMGQENQVTAIYDIMSSVKPPIYTLCVGTAWGEAALLLSAGEKGHRSALPSSSIMIRQPTGRYQGQATVVDKRRTGLRLVKAQWNYILAKHTGKTLEQIEVDVKHPKYFSPSEAVEYGIIDKVYSVEKRKSLKKEVKKEEVF